jgi:hypothetical protein
MFLFLLLLAQMNYGFTALYENIMVKLTRSKEMVAVAVIVYIIKVGII